MQILKTHDEVAEKTQIYVPYNILPLDPDSANQAIMRYSEVCLQLLMVWNADAFFFFCLNLFLIMVRSTYFGCLICRFKLLF